MFNVSFCIVFISSILYICVWKKVSNLFSLFYIMYDVKKCTFCYFSRKYYFDFSWFLFINVLENLNSQLQLINVANVLILLFSFYFNRFEPVFFL